jgi:hypothetical protein
MNVRDTARDFGSETYPPSLDIGGGLKIREITGAP